MGAPTQTYVDPSIAADSGAGTVGDPYGDLQHALDTITRDSSNGDQINVKAGTDEILAAALTLATYGTPSVTASLFIRGYTSAAGDGGIGGISGNATYGMWTSAYNYVHMIEMNCHNSGSVNIVTLGTGAVVDSCEVNNSTGRGITVGAYGSVINNHIHNCGSEGIKANGVGCLLYHNYLENGTNDFSDAIATADGATIFMNIINVDGSSDGIQSGNADVRVYYNTVYSNGGTGNGIRVISNNGIQVVGNYIEGFSGGGARGIHMDASVNCRLYGHNKAYNNTTNFNIAGDVWHDLGNNSALGASALSAPGSDDFTVDTTLKALGWPSDFNGASTNQFLDVGAAQREEAGGGTSGKQGLHPIESGSA